MPYILAALALALSLLLTGCGQMGPLYEPEDSIIAPATAPAAVPAASAP